jgi:hypothetical protein
MLHAHTHTNTPTLRTPQVRRRHCGCTPLTNYFRPLDQVLQAVPLRGYGGQLVSTGSFSGQLQPEPACAASLAYMLAVFQCFAQCSMTSRVFCVSVRCVCHQKISHRHQRISHPHQQPAPSRAQSAPARMGGPPSPPASMLLSLWLHQRLTTLPEELFSTVPAGHAFGHPTSPMSHALDTPHRP